MTNENVKVSEETKMYVSHDKTTARGRRKRTRAAECAEDQDGDYKFLNSKRSCARDENRSEMTEIVIDDISTRREKRVQGTGAESRKLNTTPAISIFPREQKKTYN
jgi:hypothetical protein